MDAAASVKIRKALAEFKQKISEVWASISCVLLRTSWLNASAKAGAFFL
jgi:hypothetical protein